MSYIIILACLLKKNEPIHSYGAWSTQNLDTTVKLPNLRRQLSMCNQMVTSEIRE